MSSVTVKMSSGGRLVIPVAMRRELGLEEGVAVILKLEHSSMTIRTVSRAMDAAKAMIAEYVPRHVSLVDELIADRREEAESE